MISNLDLVVINRSIQSHPDARRRMPGGPSDVMTPEFRNRVNQSFVPPRLAASVSLMS
jgi:hypothetical protein